MGGLEEYQSFRATLNPSQSLDPGLFAGWQEAPKIKRLSADGRNTQGCGDGAGSGHRNNFDSVFVGGPHELESRV